MDRQLRSALDIFLAQVLLFEMFFSGPLQLVVQHRLQKQDDAGFGQVLGGCGKGLKRGLI